MVAPPADPAAAATHPDPYPYYADLVRRCPLYRDDALGLWVASSADAVTAVLTSAACRVRPAAEPVPAALVDSPAGAIFGHLVRMNDGARHQPLKAAVSSTLDALDEDHAQAVSHTWARALAAELAPHRAPARIDEFASRLTACVVARLLGAPPEVVPEAARWTADFARGLAPGSSPEQVGRANTSAGHLLAMGQTLTTRGGLLASLARHARDHDAQAIVANAVGFLSQAYDATTGLIGNTLLVLTRDASVRDAALADRSLLAAILSEVLRHDPPVQNTRRFVVEDAVVGGAAMAAGDAILVLLAAANRDPAANADPARFDIARTAPRLFTFGVGAHACPGPALATTIAAAGVATLMTSGMAFDRLAETVSYRPSLNARIPSFGGGETVR